MKKVILLVVFCVVSLSAQWSSNAGQNLMISDTTGEQALVKVAPIPVNDSAYISWFDNRGGSYAMYLQLIDVMGNKQFAPQGLLVSNNQQSSSLVDYSLISDKNRGAVVTFSDTRLGGQITPFAYRYYSSGVKHWDVGLSNNSTVFQADPRVMETTDGSFIFAWTYAQAPNKIALQKLSANGVLMWNAGNPILYQSTISNENFQYQLLVPSDSGCVIMVYTGATGSFPAQSVKLYAQKIGPNGEYKWGTSGITVQALGRIASFTRPKAVSDGNNGVIISWHDDRDGNNLSSPFVQRINSAGVQLFPLNGAECTTVLDNHFDPIALYLKTTNEVMVFWNHRNSGQTQQGVSGQLLSATGTRLWSDAGKDFLPLAQSSLIGPYGSSLDSSAYLAYYNGASTVDNQVFIARINRQGNYVWNNQTRMLSTVSSEKIRIQFYTDRYNAAKAFWQDRRNDGGGIYAQNITQDGALGLYTVPVETGKISATRNDGSVTLQWEVITETNNRGFIIEKKSSAGDFVRVGFVEGRGSSVTPKNYSFTDNSAGTGSVTYRIHQIDFDGTLAQVGSVIYFDAAVTGFALNQNYPNPFNPSTSIVYSVPENTYVRLSIFDVLGNVVSTPVNSFQQTGSYSFSFDASRLAGGVYYYTLQAGGTTLTKKMMLLK